MSLLLHSKPHASGRAKKTEVISVHYQVTTATLPEN